MEQLSFAGRVAVVTGAGRGLGRAYAMLLAARGASVVVNDLGGDKEGDGADSGPAQDVVRTIVAAGGRAAANTSDVSTPDGGQSVVDSALEAFGRVDIVVNNAGIIRWQGLPEVDADNIDQHYAVHARGTFNVVRAAWPHLVAQNYGRIVLTTSTGMFGRPDNIGYAIAKSGTVGMARALTANAGEQDIKINCIAPLAWTRMGARPGQDPSQPAPPHMEPELVAPMVAYLAHSSCDARGGVYAAGSGRCNRIFIAATQGFVQPDDQPLTPEHIAENWGVINNEENYFVPADPADWGRHFMAHRLPNG